MMVLPMLAEPNKNRKYVGAYNFAIKDRSATTIKAIPVQIKLPPVRK